MPIIVDLSHPLIMLQGENGSGKSTLLHSIYYALRGAEMDGYVYRLDRGQVTVGEVYLFDAEAHNPRTHLEEGTILLLDEPEMALSPNNQRRILKMLKELVDQKKFRIICATHSEILTGDPQTYVINLDNYINRNVVDAGMGVEGASTIQ